MVEETILESFSYLTFAKQSYWPFIWSSSKGWWCPCIANCYLSLTLMKFWQMVQLKDIFKFLLDFYIWQKSAKLAEITHLSWLKNFFLIAFNIFASTEEFSKDSWRWSNDSLALHIYRVHKNTKIPLRRNLNASTRMFVPICKVKTVKSEKHICHFMSKNLKIIPTSSALL